jgi:hypothetical protein
MLCFPVKSVETRIYYHLPVHRILWPVLNCKHSKAADTPACGRPTVEWWRGVRTGKAARDQFSFRILAAVLTGEVPTFLGKKCKAIAPVRIHVSVFEISVFEI